jgi:hypothetical protein
MAEFGLRGLPDYVDSYTTAMDKQSVANAVRTGLAEGWKRVDGAAAGTLVILRVAGRPWHCAVAADGQWMLHTLQNVNVCMERMDSQVWRNRIEGYYQHVG